MRREQNKEGWVMFDHRAGPGAGSKPAGKLWESAIKTCSHCQRQIIMNPDRSRARNYCRECDSYICDDCAAERAATGYVHQSFKQKMDAILEAAARSTNIIIL